MNPGDSKPSGKSKVPSASVLSKGLSTSKTAAKCDSTPVQSFKFEVSGKVQGVFFRKYTQVESALLLKAHIASHPCSCVNDIALMSICLLATLCRKPPNNWGLLAGSGTLSKVSCKAETARRPSTMSRVDSASNLVCHATSSSLVRNWWDLSFVEQELWWEKRKGKRRSSLSWSGNRPTTHTRIPLELCILNME